MNKIIKFFLDLLYKAESKDANAKQIAKHLAQNHLYERKKIDALYPDLAEKTEKLIAKMKELNMPVKIFESFRSAKKQDKYYAQGRTEPGKIITNARGMESWHQTGLATDIVFVKYMWTPPDKSWWQTLGEEGEKLNLIWGGRWKTKDYPHFQLRITKKLDLKKIAEYFKQHG